MRKMFKNVRIQALCIGIIALVACQSSPSKNGMGGGNESSEKTFVTAEGQRLYKDGKPYYFVGTNFWYGAHLGTSEEGRRRLVRELDELKLLGITNLRILAGSENAGTHKATIPSFTLAPNSYNEELLQGLDVVLDELAKRDMLAVLYLSNFWKWSGGMTQYLAWSARDSTSDSGNAADGSGLAQNAVNFYDNEQAQRWYQDWISTLVQRVNTVNGKLYKDDKAIMSWQLANEPRLDSDEHGKASYKHYTDWVQSSARYIKSLDENHLISTGSEGVMGSARNLDLYSSAHDIPEIDYLTFHMWPKDWGWFDLNNADNTQGQGLVKAKAYMLQHIEVAKQLNKPTVLEAFAIERDNASSQSKSKIKSRDLFYREVYRFIEHHAKLGGPIAGSNYWAWGGAGRAQQLNFNWQNGDPFTGDPPSFDQGLNSMFDGDKSTLEVIYNHSEAMQRIP